MMPQYVDDGALRPQDGVGLDAYLRTTDRAGAWPAGAQPFFSGREGNINAFRDMLRCMVDGERMNLVFIIHGAVGAGKSALLHQLAADMGGLSEAGGQPWLPVRLARSDTASPHAAERAANRAAAALLAQQGNEAIRQAAERAQSVIQRALEDHPDVSGSRREALNLINDLGEGLSDPSGADDRDWRVRDLVDRAGSGVRRTLHAALRRGFGAFGVSLGPAPGLPDEGIADVVAANPGLWQEHRIVFFIDEAQNLNPDSESAKDLLQTIYQGDAGVAVGLCFGGLPDTEDVLMKMGISRLPDGRIQGLAPLPVGDAEKVVRRAFKQFGVRGGEGWARPLAERSCGWPQHVQRHLAAALAAIQDAGMDAERADFAKAVREGDLRREDYYRRRRRSMRDYVDAAVGVAEAFAQEPEGSLRNPEIAHAAGLSDDPEGYRDFRLAAVRAGLLAEVADSGGAERYRVPIPSFAAFLREEPAEPIPTLDGPTGANPPSQRPAG